MKKIYTLYFFPCIRKFLRLPSGLRKALKTSGWEYERILNGRCTDMESSLVCLIVDYGVDMTFDEDGIIQEKMLTIKKIRSFNFLFFHNFQQLKRLVRKFQTGGTSYQMK